VALVALLAAAGCAPGSGDGFGLAQNCASASLPPGGGTGAATSHGQPSRNDGAVEVTPDGAGFRARRSVHISNDFGGAAQADVEFSTANGSVVSCAGGQGGYGIWVLLDARAPTEQEARDALDSMVVNHQDVLAGGLLKLATRVEFRETTTGQNLPLPVNTGSSPAVQRAASILAGMPSAPSYVFTHSTTNGPVEASGFSGTAAALDSTNGSVALNGRWAQASLDTTNGPLYASGDFAAVTGDTTNGPVYAELATIRSVDASFNATNSSIEVALAVSGSPGFDLTADTTNGYASISVAGAQPVGEQHGDSAHHMTPDYASRAVKVNVDGNATNGNISIHD
jgi:hypothetical protein